MKQNKNIMKNPIIEKIKTFSDVLDHLGLESKDVIPYTNPVNKRQKFINASVKMSLIAEVLNEGVVLDFSNSSQPKYYPYFEKSDSGWSVYSFGSSYAIVEFGFAFFYKSSELALYAANQFLDIYIDYLPE